MYELEFIEWIFGLYPNAILLVRFPVKISAKTPVLTSTTSGIIESPYTLKYAVPIKVSVNPAIEEV